MIRRSIRLRGSGGNTLVSFRRKPGCQYANLVPNKIRKMLGKVVFISSVLSGFVFFGIPDQAITNGVAGSGALLTKVVFWLKFKVIGGDELFLAVF